MLLHFCSTFDLQFIPNDRQVACLLITLLLSQTLAFTNDDNETKDSFYAPFTRIWLQIHAVSADTFYGSAIVTKI